MTETAPGPLPRLALQPRRIVYLVLGIAALFLGDHLGLAYWGTALLFSPILVIEGALRLLVKKRLPAFRAGLLQRISAGAGADELLALYQEATFLRFAAPGHEMLAWLGRIYGHTGQDELAATTFERALEECPQSEANALGLSLGDAQFALGDHEEAERTYRASLSEEHRSPRACANLARIILDRDGDLQEAESYLLLAVEGDRGGLLRLELAELQLRLGKDEDASWQLDLAAEELEQAGADEAAQEKLEALRGKLG